jgi:hypothetical protein
VKRYVPNLTVSYEGYFKYLTKRQMRMGLEDGTFSPCLDAKFLGLFELGA